MKAALPQAQLQPSTWGAKGPGSPGRACLVTPICAPISITPRLSLALITQAPSAGPPHSWGGPQKLYPAQACRIPAYLPQACCPAPLRGTRAGSLGAAAAGWGRLDIAQLCPGTPSCVSLPRPHPSSVSKPGKDKSVIYHQGLLGPPGGALVFVLILRARERLPQTGTLPHQGTL